MHAGENWIVADAVTSTLQRHRGAESHVVREGEYRTSRQQVGSLSVSLLGLTLGLKPSSFLCGGIATGPKYPSSAA